MNPLTIFKLGSMLAIVATAYFAVGHYNHVIAENEALKTQVATAVSERDSYQQIVETMAKNELERERNVIRQTRRETIIREKPVTRECVDTPAIKEALSQLGGEGGQP